jgi:hypothetical protein
MARFYAQISSLQDAAAAAGVALMTATAALIAAEPVAPAHSGTRMIASSELAVEIMDPADEARYNNGVRFTPLANVLRVTGGGHQFLYSPVAHNPQTDNGGLASEFDLVTSPPGYKEAKPGEPFLKVGVGTLKKEGGNYRFFQNYEPVKLAATRVKWGEDTASFEQQIADAGGFGYTLTAVVSVKKRTLTVDWTLTNTGEQQLTTDTYTHNYFAFDGATVGPDYVLAFPFDFTPGKLRVGQKQVGRELHFIAPLEKPINLGAKTPADYQGPNACTVRHTSSGLGIDVLTSVPGPRTAIHAFAGALCPEQFIHIELAPGQSRSWTRTYTFIW